MPEIHRPTGEWDIRARARFEKLAYELLRRPEETNYIEFPLYYSQATIEQVLEAMHISDMLKRPGDIIGSPQFCYYGEDKLGLSYEKTVQVTDAPRHASLVVAEDFYKETSSLQYFVGVCLDYGYGGLHGSQLVGMASSTGVDVSAIRLEGTFGDWPGECLDGSRRPADPHEVWGFVEQVKDMLILPRRSYI